MRNERKRKKLLKKMYKRNLKKYQNLFIRKKLLKIFKLETL